MLSVPRMVLYVDIIDEFAVYLYTPQLPVESSSNQTKSPSDQTLGLKPVAVRKLCNVSLTVVPTVALSSTLFNLTSFQSSNCMPLAFIVVLSAVVINSAVSSVFVTSYSFEV